MPRSAFFSKETITAAGLEIIRRHGDGRNPDCQGGTEYFFRSSLNKDIKESYQLTDEKVLILYQQLRASNSSDHLPRGRPISGRGPGDCEKYLESMTGGGGSVFGLPMSVEGFNPLRTGFRKFILCVMAKMSIDYQLVTKPAAHNGPEMGPSCENQFVSN